MIKYQSNNMYISVSFQSFKKIYNNIPYKFSEHNIFYMYKKKMCTNNILNGCIDKQIAIIELGNTFAESLFPAFNLIITLDLLYNPLDVLNIGNNVNQLGVGTCIAGVSNELKITADEIGIMLNGDEGIFVLPLGRFKITANILISNQSAPDSGVNVQLVKDGVLLNSISSILLPSSQGDIFTLIFITDSNFSSYRFQTQYISALPLALSEFNLYQFTCLIEKI